MLSSTILTCSDAGLGKERVQNLTSRFVMVVVYGVECSTVGLGSINSPVVLVPAAILAV